MRLRTDDALLMSPLHVAQGQGIEIVRSPQNVRHRIVDVGKFPQVAEVIGGAQLGWARMGERHTVFLRKPECQLRLEGAFDVQVQLPSAAPVYTLPSRQLMRFVATERAVPPCAGPGSK